MSVRLRLALTVFLAGLAAALGCIAAVTLAFQRFEHESTYQRGDALVGRVVSMHGDLLDQQLIDPEGLQTFLRGLVLYDADSQLYLLDLSGRILSSSSQRALDPEIQVALAPVLAAVQAAAQGDARRAAYVMGDDPERKGADTVIAARPLMRTRIGGTDRVAGYLYLVCRRPLLPGPRLAMFGSSLARPALVSVLTVIVLTTALAAWIIIAVTRPLRVLSDEVALAAQRGFTDTPQARTTDWPAAVQTLGRITDDEFGRLRGGFHVLLARLHMQWDELKRLDHFRRESVSNLSHDLRSPLTATVACLETLEQRWAADPQRRDDTALIHVALRNTRNAAGMVRSLSDLAVLDEPEFRLRRTRMDLGEVLDDIALRFAPRATQQGVLLGYEQQGDALPVADVDTELFERAVANLLDNALKFTPAGRTIRLSAQRIDGPTPVVVVSVTDAGAGIAARHLPRLFDRHYQGRASVAPATSDEGKGLGLAIVKRIAELHGGTVEVRSEHGQGTTASLTLPA